MSDRKDWEAEIQRNRKDRETIIALAHLANSTPVLGCAHGVFSSVSSASSSSSPQAKLSSRLDESAQGPVRGGERDRISQASDSSFTAPSVHPAGVPMSLSMNRGFATRVAGEPGGPSWIGGVGSWGPVVDENGHHRFKKNAIVRHILDNGGIDLNDIARLQFSDEDQMQFAQLNRLLGQWLLRSLVRNRRVLRRG